MTMITWEVQCPRCTELVLTAFPVEAIFERMDRLEELYGVYLASAWRELKLWLESEREKS